MKLNKLIETLGISTESASNPDITGIQSDSRKIEPGALFVAIKGTASDGHEFIDKAIALGAAAIVGERRPTDHPAEIPFVKVGDSAKALGLLMAAWFDYPSEKLILVGVTGTNGKTTTATLLYEMFRRMGHKAGLLSTVCNYIDGKAVAATHTTPDPVELQALLAQMVNAGCEYVFMEVSSHAVEQKRISGLAFDGAIFTNLTRDHLDYHKTVENYLRTKKRFFDELPSTAFALTNIDDKNGLVMLQNTSARKLTYSLYSLADTKGKILASYFDGTELEINGREVAVRFVGHFNAYNLLAVYGTAVALGKEPLETLVALSEMPPVAGRFETLQSPLGYTAIVDYAHTPDALINVLKTIRDVQCGNGRIITVVGAGGNRDKGKRPLMAEASARLSDQLILTSDNPRFEEPDEIINDMASGLTVEYKTRTLLIPDRAQAIKTAALIAQKGDVILVAGKGHEDYQEIRGVKHHFDDREQIREIFNAQ
ncbi:MAG: UDP-N-acetylmuramoyl-L-alanyl-D-glutamate--2,6-diaminopimelate ligase [Tannerellaceae bacterium]|jgi:UDP-N-acetylmuramoyl-L-alanyl-D-glutamate--2,6-diaminopimelate ligase|nr:UDP-N-acetylmuramoyl-L-alanyl-D-glutamate--2,6-diaminopimelate ligase [Tannerellaceae bacterium]